MASIVFGAYIALTSAVLIVVGVQAWGGWLSIVYGLLGISTGLAGVAATFVHRPFRSALFGWFLAGVAFRSVIDGSVYLLLFTVPFAFTLLAALVVELRSQVNLANVAAGLGAGAAAIVAMFVLSALGPFFPAICPPTRPGVYFAYPGNVGFWGGAESNFATECLSKGVLTNR